MEKAVDMFKNASVAVPTENTLIHKDCCTYGFDTPLNNPHGLYVCMKCFVGVGTEFLQFHNKMTSHNLFLRIKKTEVAKNRDENGEPVPKKPLQLVVDDESSEIVSEYGIVSFPSLEEFPIPLEGDKVASSFSENESIQETIRSCAVKIIQGESAEQREKAKAWVAGANLPVSVYAIGLEQSAGPKYSNDHRTWKCGKEGCNVTGNLWLSLHDGTMLCGRKNELCEGNNHALEHYNELKKSGIDHSLVVKMGTITASGGDVYSYTEDDMVIDPKLEAHLKTYGLDMNKLQKTAKTMVELELEQNINFEERMVLSASEHGKCVSGPHLIGIRNDGNTCYVAAVIQMLFSIPEISRFFEDKERIERTFETTTNPYESVLFQLHRIGRAFASGKTPKEGITPSGLKRAVGKVNTEFSGSGQQDALEFLMALLNCMKRELAGKSANDSLDLDGLLYYIGESRLVFESKYVSYSQERNLVFNVPVERSFTTNQKEVDLYEARLKAASNPSEKSELLDNIVYPIIPFSSCLGAAKAPEYIDGYRSPVSGASVVCEKTTRFATFPPYLFLCVKRFEVTPTFDVKKLCASIDVPNELDLAEFRTSFDEGSSVTVLDSSFSGPNSSASSSASADPSIVSALESMGFPHNRSVRAAIAAGNGGVETAVEWLMTNMDDPSLDKYLYS